MKQFNGVKVFSATLARNREELGEKVTQWLQAHPDVEVIDMRVVQSSDREFHCISLVLFYNEELS
jgi:folate-dependent tRNA-U54 methylase TrmFO/GidA